MARILFTASADADSAGILNYLNAKAGWRAVLKYRALFQKLYERLADHPDSCPARSSLGPGVRIGIVSPYIVIYRHVEAEDQVVVLRIVHGGRKITGAMLTTAPE